MFQNMGYVFGMKIITDVNCYKTKTIMYGTADKNRPNNKKPLYRKKTIVIPLMYMVKGLGIICHPSLIPKIKAAIEDENKRMTVKVERKPDPGSMLIFNPWKDLGDRYFQGGS